LKEIFEKLAGKLGLFFPTKFDVDSSFPEINFCGCRQSADRHRSAEARRRAAANVRQFDNPTKREEEKLEIGIINK
jgi:hypothetical protein